MSASRGYAPSGPLTPAMVATLRCASRGCTIVETANELHYAVSTVNALRAAACARLGASNVVAAVYTASRRGEL